MAKYFVDGQDLTDIANAIRERTGKSANMEFPDEFVSEIEGIGGGITPTGTINITQNGTTDVTQYASANVAVPNSYAAADEGKVVSNGALVAQTSKNVSANGTVDTTLNNQVVVAVPNSYSASDEGKVVSNGALVAQGSDTVTENDTYDTTLISSLTVNVPSSGTTMYTGTYTPSTMPAANVPFSCAGATNFLIRVADTATINTGTGHAYFYLIYANTSKTSQFGSNNGGTAIANGTDRYTTGARNGTAPGVQFTADGVEVIYYNSTTYRWFQAGLTYNWYAW